MKCKKPLKKPKTNKHNWKKFSILSSLSLLGIIAILLVIWLISIFRTDAPKMIANVYAPYVSNFTDDNNMLFPAQNALPDVNNNRELTPPDAVTISYNIESGSYVPTFKMDSVDADLVNKIKIVPFIKGTWHLHGDSTLVFKPETNWPADTKFTVKINSDLFNDDVDVNTSRISFTTPEITAKVDNFNLYPAPKDKQSVVGIAVISFDYEIDTTDFNKKVSLKLDDEKLDFSVKFDRFHRTAFIISEPVKVTNEPQIMRIKLNRIPAMAGDSRTKKLTAKTTIESADNIFKIASVETTVVDDKDGNAQQLILLNTTSAAQGEKELVKYITAYLLPEYHDADEEENKTPHIWQNDEITKDVLEKSKHLEISPMEFAVPNGVYQYAFSYDVSENNTRYIYVDIKSGAISGNGFLMKNGVSSVMRVPYPDPTVTIAGSGALLSLSGDQALGIMARGGVDTAYVNLYKVKSEEINHLISQTYNVFAPNMEFKSWSFGVYDMSVVFQKKISFANPSMKKTNYASIDLGDYLDRTYNDKSGIFIIQTGASENAAEYNDKRLIIMTDLGIIRKVNIDGSSAVFVSNLYSGTPASDIEISVLGRNGNAIWAGITDINGRADIPALPWSEYKNAREPVAVVARRGDDVSFIPYNAYNQQVEYSKFDVDGVYSSASTPLNAFLFSDRGIYRPGEPMVIGGIVKNKQFKSLTGIPVKIQVRDARGRIVLEKAFSLTADGMFDIKYEIPSNANLGNWSAYLYALSSNDKLSDMLGTVNFDVQEFVPDTLKITANIIGASDKQGWLPLNNLKANVSLRNLFGTPATNNRITATAVLTPVEYSFDKFKDYKFTPNFISGTGLAENTARNSQTYSENLPDEKTNESGTADINVTFNKNIPSGTYVLNLNIQGFEAGSGKSVQTNITTRVSDAKYLIGWKSSADLNYINKNSVRKIKLVAVDHTENSITVDGLKLRIIKREKQTSLVKDYSNYYKYQTVSRDKIISETNINIPRNGTEITLDTQNSGTYFMQVLDASDKILANAEYYIAGEENISMSSDIPAELQIKLNKSEYKPGEDIEVSITAPYTGTGLITIERDKVYAYEWFNTNSTSSVQRITLPSDFEGTGYINVSFVRDINSKDIFTTPYAYAVAPFSADVSKHKIAIKLDVPEKVENNELTIRYTTDKNAKMMLFAVNEGILQVAKYKMPNPLAHFFQKSALQVTTYQILSLLLPEYNILKEYAKTGGGDYAAEGGINQILNNPFTRKSLPPVAFYSQIIDAKANVEGNISFDIPEYFNGSLRIFAVAANTTAVGSANTKVLVQSPIVISTSTPLAVAPGDKFDINSVITNLTDDNTTSSTVKISAGSTGGIKITDNVSKELSIPKDTEKLVTFNAVTTKDLGNADINISASLSSDGKEQIKRTATNTLSVRPITNYTTDIKSGVINSKNTKISKFKLNMYPEFSTRRLYISQGAQSITIPLFEYLKQYEYPCTEQLVSKTIPYAIMPNSSIIGTSLNKSAEKISETINTLKNRQNDDGSFVLWAGGATPYDNASDSETAYLTAYVVQFLTIAKEAGFSVPTEMLSRGLDFLRTFAGGTITDDNYAKAVAYAIYIISENGYVTTNYIDEFTQYANENMKNWKSELVGAYIATSYNIMKQHDLADDLISKYKLSDNDKFEYNNMFDNNIANDAMYHYLTAKYFGNMSAIDSKIIHAYIESGNYSAYTSAIVIMGLNGTDNTTKKIPTISISVNGENTPITKTYETEFIADIPDSATEINITCDECEKNNSLFYALLQQGYPTDSKSESNGIEIIREYYDSEGNEISSGRIGDTITVKIFARTRGGVDLAENVVISDLLPGGFIADVESATGDMKYIEMREDRVLIYTDLNRHEQQFTYKVQLGTAGIFTIPAVTASSMYNPQINATAGTGSFTVTNETSER